MPKKLIVVLVFVAISLVLNALAQSWVAVAFNAAIGVALYKGHEAVRTFILWTSAFGAVGYGLLLALAAIAAVATGFNLVVMVGLAAFFFGFVQCVFTVLALRDPEVQKWMYDKSMGGGSDDPSAF